MALNVSDNKRIANAIVFPLIILTFQFFILTVFNLMEGPLVGVVQLISKLIVGIMYISTFPIIWRNNKSKFFGTYLVVIIIFLLQYLAFPVNRVHLNDIIFPLFFMCLPSFVYSATIDNWVILKTTMEKAAIKIFIMGLAISVLVFLGTVPFETYSMSFSYYMLLPAVIYINKLFEFPSSKNILLFVGSAFVILALGARGPLMCLAGFILLRIFRLSEGLTIRRVMGYCIMFLISLLCILYIKEILLLLDGVFLKCGIHSRSITLLLRTGIYLSGRDRLFEIVINEILKRPIVGLGLAGDRVFIDGYVHNLFIEVVSHFGVVVGSILLIWFFLRIARELFVREAQKYELLIMWFSVGVLPLMVSGTYLTDINFWIFTGLIIGPKGNLVKTEQDKLF